jgi:riboflavin biosynthesis pyrimidine reductase
VRAEKYGPVQLDEEVRRRRVARHQPELPRLAIVSGRGNLDPQMRVFTGSARPVLITTDRVLSERPELSDLADVITCGEAHVDLQTARQVLWSEGWHRVLCEGGPSLFRSLLINDLVDELCLSVAPVLAGSEHKHLTADAPLAELTQFRLVGLLESDGLLLCRYARVRRQPAGNA